MKWGKKQLLKNVIYGFPFVLLIVSFIAMGYYHNQFYSSVERVDIYYENSEIPVVVNYYRPAKTFEEESNTYQKPPVLLYFTGFEAQKDLDLRTPVEFSRRGFAVISMELRGHGEMQPYFGPEIIDDARAVLDYIYDNLANEVDLSRVSILGHSGGGLGVLGVLDPRVNVTVTWAAPCYISGRMFNRYIDSFSYYNPIVDIQEAMLEFNETAPYQFLTPEIPRNLLVIHHLNDGVVEYEMSQKIQEKTGATVISLDWEEEKIIPFLDGIQDGQLAHLLLEKRATIESINWIEEKLNYYPSQLKQPFEHVDLISLNVYVVIFTWLLSLFLSLFSLAVILGNYLKRKENISNEYPSYVNQISGKKTENITEDKKNLGILGVFSVFAWSLLLSSLFFINSKMDAIKRYQSGLNYYLIYSSLLVFGVWVLYSIISNKISNTNIKSAKLFDMISINGIKKQLRFFGMGLISGGVFWLIYFAFTFGFKFFVILPLNISDFLNAFIRVLPYVAIQGVLIKYFYYNMLINSTKTNTIRKNSIITKFIKFIGGILHIMMYGIFFSLAPGLLMLILSILIVSLASIAGYILFLKTRNIWIMIGLETFIFAFIYSKMYLTF